MTDQMASETAVNWTPERVATTKQLIAQLEQDAERDEVIADALREHSEEHANAAWLARQKVKRIRERMEYDHVDEGSEIEPRR